MNFEQTLASARERPNDESALSDLARMALTQAREDDALTLLRRGAERCQSARLWQWTALLERSLEEHGEALASFAKAAALAPRDRSIAHGRARVALEAGVPSGKLFETALQVSPGDQDVLLGYAASLFADGRPDAAETLLEDALASSPLWTEGHIQLAQLRSILGRKDQAADTLESAIALHPRREQLWTTLFDLLVQAQQFSRLDEAVARAARHSQSETMLRRYEAIAAIEQKNVGRADCLLQAMPPDRRRSMDIWSIRHLLRTGRLGAACASIDLALKTESAPNVWPYAAIAWRLAGDPRYKWLEGDLDRTISVIDLTSELRDLSAIEQVLRKLHSGKGEYLDQSVRGGSQTDGPLFTRIDPQIRALRGAITHAVEGYVANLPPADRAHPLLGAPRDRRTRFSGSWSVLLRGGGYHANHVHPQGWISSALYIRLPARCPEEPSAAGWLTLGEAQAELGLDLNPIRQIEPKVGRLVLFPSYMWHGTHPFGHGERLTVAFDVQRPV